MLSKPLIYIGIAFQVVGIVWDFVYHVTDEGGLGDFLAAAHWPIFLGFVLILVAVLQSFPKNRKEDKPNDNNP